FPYHLVVSLTTSSNYVYISANSIPGVIFKISPDDFATTCQFDVTSPESASTTELEYASNARTTSATTISTSSTLTLLIILPVLGAVMVIAAVLLSLFIWIRRHQAPSSSLTFMQSLELSALNTADRQILLEEDSDTFSISSQ